MTENADKLREYLKKALAELQVSRARVRELEDASREPIAIVGIGCRYPGGIASPDDLWEVVHSGTDTLSAPPSDRGWFADGAPGMTMVGPMRQLTGGYLHDAGDFDAGFFGMTPQAAMSTDPQQRLLLETAWEALEHGGIDPMSLRGSRTGVFIGAFYRLYAVTGQNGLDPDEHLVTGVAGSVMAGRVAYELGLEGPAATVDTACSASLVALHWACQSLRLGESDLALAGGVAVNATPHMYTDFAQSIGLAPDGRCKAFAAGADGTGWSEGVGVLLLERLSRARANGHQVLGLLRGSATHRAGAANGLTAPSGQTQQRTIRQALADSGLGPADVDVVEAHGSGTRLGDSIEANAMLVAYGPGRRQDEPLLIGSIKSNIGHAQSASGVAGVIKLVQAMRHGIVPKSLHVDEPSPDIDWSTGRLGLITETMPWPDRGHPRRSAVSSFGISGTNVHIILEQAPPEEPARPAGASLPLLAWPVSGKTPQALAAQATRLLSHLDTNPEQHPLDLAYSLATTRSHFEHRAVILGADRDQLIAGLTALTQNTPADGLVIGQVCPDREVAFVLPGRGQDWYPAGRELYQTFPAYARAFDDAAAEADKHLDIPLRDTPADVVLGVTADLWHLAHQVAAHRLLESCAIRPDTVAGRGVGEIAAAHLCGALSLSDAVLVTATRATSPDSLADILRSITFTPPHTTAIPSLPADPASTEDWLRQLRDTSDAQTMAVRDTENTLTICLSPRESTPGEPHTFLTTLAKAHCAGVEVTWSPIFEATGASRVSLPTYAFQRGTYWWVDPRLTEHLPAQT